MLRTAKEDGVTLPDEQLALRQTMAELSARVRTPLLELETFTPLSDEELDDDLDAPQPPLTEDARRDAEVRRGALMLAAVRLMDEAFDDFSSGVFDDAGADDEDLADTFVHRIFPPRFRPAYRGNFPRSALATLCKVVADLGDPRAEHPACLAEEMITYAIVQDAYELMDDAGFADPDELDLEGYLLEDLDFRQLYDDGMDGVENDPALQQSLGMWVPGVADWFTPFNSSRYPHPYAETAPAEDATNTLRWTEKTEAVRHDPAVVDSPAPIAGLAAVSELVRLTRAAARADGHPGVWIPDEDHPEQSFQALRDLLGTTDGSGWLTWEPVRGSEQIRQDGTIRGQVLRHFPDPDLPFLEVSLGLHYLSIPLSAVVSWHPDRKVHERWEKAFTFSPDPTG